MGSPIELYQHPANLFVAQFIGSPKMNVVPCTGGGRTVDLAGGRIDLQRRTDGAVHLGVRPEHIELVDEQEGHAAGTVDVIEHLGSDTFVYVDVPDLGLITVRIAGHVGIEPGGRTGLRFDAADVHIFDAGEQVIDD